MNFLKTTVLGGVVFLVPIVIFLIVLAHALQITGKLAAPLADLLPFSHIGDLAAAQLLALLLLVAISFLAGLAARTQVASRLVGWLETNVLERIPVYHLMKAKTDSVLSLEDSASLAPVLVRFDDSWQIALEVERPDDSSIILYLPGAPDPWSGSICIVTADRVTPLDLPAKSVTKLMQRLGKGTAELLRDGASPSAN